MVEESFSEQMHWTESLPRHIIFHELRALSSSASGAGARPGEDPAVTNIIGEAKGDLFVWVEDKKALLTTNLKHIKAFPTSSFKYQTLLLTKAPVSVVLEVAPEPSAGLMVALRFAKGLSVVHLRRSRGEHGEFGGGRAKVNCSVTDIATDMFTIFHHCLELLQCRWHPTQPGYISLLTSDNSLHLFHTDSPNRPEITISLNPSVLPAAISLQDTSFLSFCFWTNETVFALTENGEVRPVSLARDAASAAPAAATSTGRCRTSDILAMHGVSEESYSSDAWSLLILPSTPVPVVVIASSSGVLHHCVFLGDEDQLWRDEDDGGGVSGGREEPEASSSSPSSPPVLYVVESLQLDLRASLDSGSDSTLNLIADPANTRKYLVAHAEGVHAISLLWLSNWERAMGTGAVFSPAAITCEPGAKVEYLIALEPDMRLNGLVVVSEDLLGCAIIGLTLDNECVILSCRERPEPEINLTSLFSENLSLERRPPQRSNFVEHIRSILCSPNLDKEAIPLHRSYSKQQGLTQENLFGFLHNYTQAFQKNYVLPQHRAKIELEHRIRVLQEQKEQQCQELMQLRCEAREAQDTSDELMKNFSVVYEQNKKLLYRFETVLCKLSARSAVLSKAEKEMTKELEGIKHRLDPLKRQLWEADGKLTLLGRCGSESIDPLLLNRSQSDTVIKSLSENGRNIKSVSDIVQTLLTHLDLSPV